MATLEPSAGVDFRSAMSRFTSVSVELGSCSCAATVGRVGSGSTGSYNRDGSAVAE